MKNNERITLTDPEIYIPPLDGHTYRNRENKTKIVLIVRPFL